MNEQDLDALPPSQQNPQPVPPAPLTAGQATPLPAGPQPSVDDMVRAAAVASVSPAMMADDVDLIEKEWVEKAKQIVEQTKQDPYQQNAAITKVKVDYLKKRYNRDVKTGGA